MRHMPTYTITLSDVEQKGMEYIATDVDFWIQNAVHERARLGIEEMVQDHIKDKLAKGESISGTREEIAMATDLPNAVARNEATLKAMVMPPTPGEVN
jgi:hypothetical protein